MSARAPAGAIDDAALCDELQKETFDYFLNEFNPVTGLIADKMLSALRYEFGGHEEKAAAGKGGAP